MKTTKKLMTMILAFMFAFASLITVKANSYLTSDGYYFWMEGDEAVAIHGCDISKTQLFFPVMLGNAFITSIDENAFLQNKTISSVEFAQLSHITRIGDGAFYGCTGIETIALPQRLKKVSESVFQNCTALNSVELGSNVESIDAQAFYNCRNMNTINLPESLTSIGTLAFAECQSLAYLEIPQSVTRIADSTFHNDSNLTLGVYYDSYAFNYAKDNSVPYKLLDGVKLGDVDKDGEITINDATFIQRYLAELENLKGIYLYAADANKDGEVDISDATTIQLSVAECPVPYPVGEVITE